MVCTSNYVVYKHTCPNGKIYVGITSMVPTVRWNNGKGYPHNSHFQNAISKYGWNNIKHEILFENLTKEQACQKEIELITKYKSNNPKFGYNLTDGGQFGKHTPETIKILSEKSKQIAHTNIEKRSNANNWRKKPVIINNVIYDCVNSASRKLGIDVRTIRYYIRSKTNRFKDWRYL